MTCLSLRRLLPAFVVVVAAALSSAPAGAGPFDTFVVFGDSLSDNGNNAAAGLFDPSQTITGNTYVPSNTYGPVAPTATGRCGRATSRR
jgi:phospholipase/lecithinase/hemolysin